MKKKFLSNLLLLIILNILIKPFWFFGIEVAVQNSVGETMYGFYFSLFNFAFIANILLDVGITNYNNRALSRDHDLLSQNLAVIIPLKFILSIIYAIVIFISAAVIGYSRIQINLLIILAINQFLSSFILYLRSNISGIQLFRTDSILSVLDRTLMIVMNGILLWAGFVKQPYKIEWFVYSQTISYIITALIIFVIVLKHSGKIRIRFRTYEFKNILRKSYPFAILILLMSVFNRIDSVMIERLLDEGKRQAGVYAQSFRVLDALSQFALLFAGLLLPMFSKMIKTKQKTDELVYISSALLLAVSFGAAIAGIFFNQELITLMYGPTHADSSKILSILMPAFLFISLGYIHGTLLTANHNLKLLNTLAGITVLINVSLNLILIPRQGAVGAALSSLVSQAFYATSQFIMTHKILQIKSSGRLFTKLLLYSVIIFLSAWLLKSIFHWTAAIALFILVSIITSFITGLIQPKELIRIFREE